jgi:hypothetical protein
MITWKSCCPQVIESKQYWGLQYAPNKLRGYMDDCIEFVGYKDKDGYGKKQYKGRPWYAHRWAWTLANGEIPAGLSVCHKCDNPPCINLDHLYLGTTAQNQKDKADRGRVKGEKNPKAKLTDFDIPTIFELLHHGFAPKAIAEMYHVSHDAIKDIKNRRRWTHIPNHHA